MVDREWLEEELMVVCKWLVAAAVGIALMVVCVTAAKAEAIHLGTEHKELGFTHYPLAYVDVKPGSCLNVRKTPGGEWAQMTLPRMTDVVLLFQDGDWFYVMLGFEDEQPIGWVHGDFVTVYNQYMTDTKKWPL